MSQSATPSVKALYMPSEIPLTSRLLKVSQACGTKLAVVRKAAQKPMNSPSCMSAMIRTGQRRGRQSGCIQSGCEAVHSTSASSAGRAAGALGWFTKPTTTYRAPLTAFT